MLQNEGALVSGYDPVAMPTPAAKTPSCAWPKTPTSWPKASDALVVCTEWNEFKQLDLTRIKQVMAQPIIVDGRNIYEPEMMHDLGFIYRAVGRGQGHSAMAIDRAITPHSLPMACRSSCKESHVAPVASFWIFYRVGSRNELPGTTGISHWVEHMLFKGTERFPTRRV